MIFCIDLRSDDEPPLTKAIVFVIAGRLLDPSALAVNMHGVERQAQWSGTKLVFSEGVLVRFNHRSSRLIYELESTDLPTSIVQALNTIVEAGPEAAVAKCDLCDTLVPALLLEALTICACPACQQRRRPTTPTSLMEDPPF